MTNTQALLTAIRNAEQSWFNAFVRGNERAMRENTAISDKAINDLISLGWTLEEIWEAAQ